MILEYFVWSTQSTSVHSASEALVTRRYINYVLLTYLRVTTSYASQAEVDCGVVLVVSVV